MMLSIFVNHQERWIMVIIDIDHLWISMHELEKIFKNTIRTSVLPIHSQYEFRTTLNIISFRSTGKRFQQEFIIINNTF